MKNWLRELVERDFSEEQIRHLIRQCVRKWIHVPDREREIQCVSANGKPYKMRMPYTPNFEVFYVHRTALGPVLEAACEPGKFADGADRGFYNYR